MTVGFPQRSESYLQGSRPFSQQLFNVPGCSGHQLVCIILLHSVEVLIPQKNLDNWEAINHTWKFWIIHKYQLLLEE